MKRKPNEIHFKGNSKQRRKYLRLLKRRGIKLEEILE